MKDSRQLLQEIFDAAEDLYRKRKDYQNYKQTNKKKKQINTIVRIDFCCCGVPFGCLIKKFWKWKICITLLYILEK